MADSGVELPPVNYINIELELKDEESELYEFFLTSARKVHKQFLSGKETYMNVLTMCLRLRQICIASNLVVPRSEETKVPSSSLSQMIINDLPSRLKKWVLDKSGTSGINSTKIRKIMKIIRKVPKKDKTIIFSSFKEVINLIILALPEGTKYLIIDGSSSGAKRNDILEKFENDPNIRLLFITFKSGGQCLNLAKSANNVILVEGWWCPFVEEQATKRVIRIGQDKTVNIYKITIKDSIEDRITSICKEKLLLSDKILNGGKGSNNNMTINQIGELLK
jgi:SNF2 family DNA or RNA helicase